jgi:hypothetical protein
MILRIGMKSRGMRIPSKRRSPLLKRSMRKRLSGKICMRINGWRKKKKSILNRLLKNRKGKVKTKAGERMAIWDRASNWPLESDMMT